MTLLYLEWFKSRRRGLLLIGLALLAAQLLWVAVSLLRMEPGELHQGWMWLLYDLALIDSFMLPLAVAVIASRSCEIEHRGSTFKLLATLTSPARLYLVKLIWGALSLAALMLVRSGMLIAIGYVEAFPGGIPYAAVARFTFISWLVSVALYSLQQGLSLRFANQALPLIVGLAGSFLGLMALFFPSGLQRVVPWAYYGLLSQVTMQWDAATRVTTFFWRTPELLDLACFGGWLLLFLILGGVLFLRKEM